MRCRPRRDPPFRVGWSTTSMALDQAALTDSGFATFIRERQKVIEISAALGLCGCTQPVSDYIKS